MIDNEDDNGWADDVFEVKTSRGTLTVVGKRGDALVVYQRTLSDGFTVSYLTHLPTGLGLAAFRSPALACAAAGVVRDLISDDLLDFDDIVGPFLARLERQGFYRSHKVDDGYNLLWDRSTLEDAVADAARRHSV